jgi:serine protease inhibitor
MFMSLVHRPTRVAALGAAVLLAACGNGTGPSSDGPPEPISALPRTLTTLEQDAIRASNSFGLTLLRETAERHGGRNVILSPLSASTALGMAFAGAEGATADSMRLTLGWGSASRADILAGYRNLPALLSGLDPRVTFTSANALWVKNGFPVLPAYTQEMQQVFRADVRSGDFGPTTVADMNRWASDKTSGRIPKVVESLAPELVGVLMNALYFKGDWRDQFEVVRTRSVPFTTSAGERPSVPMMHRTGPMAFARARSARWVELPYGNTAYVMTLVLPDSGTSPQSWLRGLDGTAFTAEVQGLRTVDVDLALPKFRLAVDFQLRGPLEAMGMGIAFNPRTADFSRIGPGELYLSYVKQDVFIDVNEEGTEAAAVTQVGVGVTSVPQREMVHLNRPFAFFLRERLSGTILFAGIIEHPQR